MELYMSEKKKALEIINAKDLGYKPSESICLLAKYFIYCENKTTEETETEIINFIKNKTKINYKPSDWELCITRNIKKAEKLPLINIDYIEITQDEINVFQGLKKKQEQRLAFTLLCLAKYHNKVFEKNNSWVNTPIFQIFKMANILGGTQNDRIAMIHNLYKMGLICYSKKITNTNVQVNYIKEGYSPVALKITDMRELGKQYLMYRGEKYIKCEKCGIVFKPKTSWQKYCKDCGKYEPIETKTIICCDCNKEFDVDARNMTKVRCDDCQKEYRKQWDRERKRKKL